MKESTEERTAVLCCDLQHDIMAFLDDNGKNEVLAISKKILETSRQHKFLIVYIRVAFRPNYPEINPRNLLFAQLKSAGKLIDGSEGASIHKEVAPHENDIIVTKNRFGAFSTTNLANILRANNVTKIILFGLTTSGVILTTVREAHDLDFNITVISDACRDRVPEVHDTLMKHVFSRQAVVTTTDEWIKSLSS